MSRLRSALSKAKETLKPAQPTTPVEKIALPSGFADSLADKLTYSELPLDERDLLLDTVRQIEDRLQEVSEKLPRSNNDPSAKESIFPRVLMSKGSELFELSNELERADTWLKGAKVRFKEGQFVEPAFFQDFEKEIVRSLSATKKKIDEDTVTKTPKVAAEEKEAKPAKGRKRKGKETYGESSNDPVRHALVEITGNPQKAKELIQLSRRQLSAIDGNDPAIQAEIASANETLSRIAERLDAASPEEISAWSQELLDRLPETVSESNPLQQIQRLDAPHLTSALSAIQKKAQSIDKRRPKSIKPHRNIATNITDVAALSGLGALTYMSYFLAQGGGENVAIALMEHFGSNPQISKSVDQALNALGIKNDTKTMLVAAKWISIVATGGAFAAFIKHRDKHFWKMPLYAWLGLAPAGLMSTTVLVENAVNTENKAIAGAAIAGEIGKSKNELEKIPGDIRKSYYRVVSEVLVAAHAESKRGGIGPITMTWLYAGGLLNADFNKKFSENPEHKVFFDSLKPEIQQFLLTDFNEAIKAKPNLETQWLVRKKSLDGLRDPKKMFGNGQESLQVFNQLMNKILTTPAGEQTPGEALKEFEEAVEGAKKGDIKSALIQTSHVLDILKLVWKDAPKSMGVVESLHIKEMEALQTSLTAKYSSLLKGYETLKDTDMALISGRVTAIADAANLPELKSKLAPLFKLSALGTTSESFNKKMASLPKFKLQLAKDILTTPEGWASINNAFVKSGYDFALDQAGKITAFGNSIEMTPERKQAAVIASLVLVYMLLFDLALPEYGIIKPRNALRNRRFNREMRHAHQEIDDLSHELSTTMADYMEAYYQKTGQLLNRGASYSSAMSRDLRAAHIRGRLERMADEEISKNPGSWGVIGEELRFLESGEINDTPFESTRRTLNLITSPVTTPVGKALGFAQIPDSVALTNARVRWFSEKTQQVSEGGASALVEVMGKAYGSKGQSAVMGLAMQAMSEASTSSPSEKSLRDLEDITRTMTLDELSTAIPELSTQIAILKRGASEIQARNTGISAEPKSLSAGSKVNYTQQEIDSTYLLGSLQNDIARYETLLASCRTEGRKLLTEPGVTLPEGVASIDNLARIFDKKYVSPEWERGNIDRAQSDTLIRLMRERIGIVEKADLKEAKRSGRTLLPGTMNTDEFNTYLSELADRLDSENISGEARISANLSKAPELMGRNFTLGFGYSPLSEGPTVFLTMQANDPTTNAPIRLSVPYPGRLPDPYGKPVREAVAELKDWVSKDGSAMKTLRAQYMRFTAQENLKKEEGKLVSLYGEQGKHLRIALNPRTLSDIASSRDDSPESPLAMIARQMYLKRWLKRHEQVLNRAYRGEPLTDEQLAILNRDRRAASADSALTTFALKNVMNEIKEALNSPDVLKAAKDGLDISYDPSAEESENIVIAEKIGKKEVIEKRYGLREFPGRLAQLAA